MSSTNNYGQQPSVERHPTELERAKEKLKRANERFGLAAFANGSVFVIEYRFRNKDNQYLYIWERD